MFYTKYKSLYAKTNVYIQKQKFICKNINFCQKILIWFPVECNVLKL